MLTLISFIVVIGIIIFVHELGHFLAAKMFGVRVEVFSLGFPPKMLSRRFGETEYQIAWIPLGGYVKMSGMLDESFEEGFDRDDPRGFINQTFSKRALIITAGVIMNFILAVLIYSLLTWSEGVQVLTGTTISDVEPNSPAAEAGLMAGDKLTTIADRKVSDWEEVTTTIRQFPGEPITIEWMRGDSIHSAIVKPAAAPVLDIQSGSRDTVGKLGVYGTLTRQPVNPIKAFGYGIMQSVGVIRLNVLSIKWLLTGRARLSDLSGPLGIAKMSGESARSGMANFLAFIAFISVSIGFLNILPIPMLDGGHLMFMVIEAAIRRPIPEKLKVNLMKVGFAALIILMLFVSYHDILRFYFSK